MKFGENSSEVMYISNLLRTTYVPTIPIATSAVEGLSCVLDYPQSAVTDATTATLGTYEFGKRYLNISTNYVSDKNYYDSDLHEALGRYLRAYRDYYHVDVMAFYNCFSNRSIDTFSLPLVNIDNSTEAKQQLEIAPANSATKLYAVPVKFDAANYYATTDAATYNNTISYKFKFRGYIPPYITTQLMFFDGHSPLNITYTHTDKNASSTTTFERLIVFKPQVFTDMENLVYSVDVKIDSSNASRILSSPAQLMNDAESGGKNPTQNYEDDDIAIINKLIYENRESLYLFIELPVNWNDYIAIVELKDGVTYSGTNWSLLTDSPFSIHNITPYSDRLLEYLVGNVITPVDPIKQNIVRIQRILQLKTYGNIYGIERVNKWHPLPGIFDDTMLIYMRRSLGEGPRSRSGEIISKWVDFLGYVDKDVETALNSVKIWARDDGEVTS